MFDHHFEFLSDRMLGRINQPISSSTGQHFVDPKHVERMDADPAY